MKHQLETQKRLTASARASNESVQVLKSRQGTSTSNIKEYGTFSKIDLPGAHSSPEIKELKTPLKTAIQRTVEIKRPSEIIPHNTNTTLGVITLIKTNELLKTFVPSTKVNPFEMSGVIACSKGVMEGGQVNLVTLLWTFHSNYSCSIFHGVLHMN